MKFDATYPHQNGKNDRESSREMDPEDFQDSGV
jgi:hypothetical protein